MTLREALQKYYPEQFERILEIIKEINEDDIIGRASVDSPGCLGVAFVWDDTKEGNSYWANLRKSKDK